MRDLICGFWRERWNVCSYQRHELVIAHGEDSRDVFFVLDGQARVTLFSASGREVAYKDIHPGDIFGELAAIDGKARSASVIATEPVRAAILSAEAFQSLLKSHPSMSWALLQHLSGLVRRMTDRVFEFSTLVVRERVICELLRRADEMGQSEGGGHRHPHSAAFRAGGRNQHASRGGVAGDEPSRQERPHQAARRQSLSQGSCCPGGADRQGMTNGAAARERECGPEEFFGEAWQFAFADPGGSPLTAAMPSVNDAPQSSRIRLCSLGVAHADIDDQRQPDHRGDVPVEAALMPPA